MLEAHGFWRLKKVWLSGSGNYLANPRDTNGTPSIISIPEIPVAGQFAGLGLNSVPDQYLARAGATVPIWRGFSGSLSWRMEGLRRYDLLGDSHGWRRPGTAMFVEPGIGYARGRHAVSFNVPIGYYYTAVRIRTRASPATRRSRATSFSAATRCAWEARGGDGKAAGGRPGARARRDRGRADGGPAGRLVPAGRRLEREIRALL